MPRRRGAAGVPTGEGSPPSPEDLARKAEAYALDLLARRSRTERELSLRLGSKGYPADIVTELVARCLRVGYLDDRAFARQWVEQRSQSFPCGASRLRQELVVKGVAPTVAAEVLTELLPPEVEARLAVALVGRRAAQRPRARGGAPVEPRGGARPSPAGIRRKTEERLWGFLRRRGFGAWACQEAMKAVFGSKEEWADSGEAPDGLET